MLCCAMLCCDRQAGGTVFFSQKRYGYMCLGGGAEWYVCVAEVWLRSFLWSPLLAAAAAYAYGMSCASVLWLHLCLTIVVCLKAHTQIDRERERKRERKQKGLMPTDEDDDGDVAAASIHHPTDTRVLCTLCVISQCFTSTSWSWYTYLPTCLSLSHKKKWGAGMAMCPIAPLPRHAMLCLLDHKTP